MRHLKILLASLCVGALSQALAADPPPPPPPSSSPPAAEPEKPTAAALAEQTKRLRSMGYKAEVQKSGVTLFCRGEKPIGSNLEHKVCANGDDIERRAQDAKDAMRDHRQSH
jgi:hypothetical protein